MRGLLCATSCPTIRPRPSADDSGGDDRVTASACPRSSQASQSITLGGGTLRLLRLIHAWRRAGIRAPIDRGAWIDRGKCDESGGCAYCGAESEAGGISAPQEQDMPTLPRPGLSGGWSSRPRWECERSGAGRWVRVAGAAPMEHRCRQGGSDGTLVPLRSWPRWGCRGLRGGWGLRGEPGARRRTWRRHDAPAIPGMVAPRSRKRGPGAHVPHVGRAIPARKRPHVQRRYERRREVSGAAPPGALAGSSRSSHARASAPAFALPAEWTRRKARPEGRTLDRRTPPRRG